MAAIALAESGGNSTALNDNSGTGDYSVGLWQINYYGGLLAPRTAAYGSPSSLQADPAAQAKAAVSIEKSQGLRAWSTYSSGAYTRYLSGAAPDTSVTGGGGNGATTAQNASDTSSDCLIAIPSLGPVGGGCWLSKSEGRIVLGALIMPIGFGIGLVGVILLTAYGLRSSGALRTAGTITQAGGAAVSWVAPPAGGVIARAGSAARTAGSGGQLPVRRERRPAREDEEDTKGQRPTRRARPRARAGNPSRKRPDTTRRRTEEPTP
jgi:hypothetical protein